MSALMVHAGSKRVEWDQVVATPCPMGTETHITVPHHALYEMAKRSIVPIVGAPENEGFAVSTDGDKFFALMEFGNSIGGDYSLCVGIRNSHDKSFAAGFVVGNRVFVCDNLAFTGESRAERRHTVNIWRDLPQVLSAATARIPAMIAKQSNYIDFMKHTVFDNNRVADSFMLRGYDSGVLTKRTFFEARENWYNPQCDYESQYKHSVWGLYNACTRALRGSGGRIFSIADETFRLQSFVNKIVPNNPAFTSDKGYLLADSVN